MPFLVVKTTAVRRAITNTMERDGERWYSYYDDENYFYEY